MNDMRAMIVDDEAPARSELRFLLEETGRLEEIIEATVQGMLSRTHGVSR